MNDRLTPRNGTLYIVRWIRDDGRDVKHKYFTRRHDAEQFANKLVDHGKDTDDVAIFTTTTTWEEV